MSGRPAPAVVLFNRDLRIRDHPALRAAAAGGRRVLPVFVLDDALLRSPTTGPNRVAFLLESLEDLRQNLRHAGAQLYVRRGDPVATTRALALEAGADTIHVSSDVTSWARNRTSALRAAVRGDGIAIHEHPGAAIVEPGALVPSGGGDHYKVFTPYFRAWSAMARRPVFATAEDLSTPGDIEPGVLLDFAALCAGSDPLARTDWAPLDLGAPSPRRDAGGEAAALTRLDDWLASDGPATYASDANALGVQRTSRLSAYLHFGCLSSAELESVVRKHSRLRSGAPDAHRDATEGVDAFVRQLCWRDFYLAVTHAFPAISRRDYRPRPVEWRRDDADLEAWKQGRTGVALVDAAMRQLLEEGFVHNRARLVASSYLTKTLRHDWREGAAHYRYWLTDGDVAANSGNWQWMAGTGNDTRPNRVLSPTRQAERFDPDGAYRRRYGGLSGAPSQLRFGDAHS